MPFTLHIKDDLNEEDLLSWNRFVLSDKGFGELNYSIGNNPVLAKILSGHFGANPFYLFVQQDGKLSGVMQGCLKDDCMYSLPVFSTSGLLTLHDKEEIYRQITTKFPRFQVRDFTAFSENTRSHKLSYYIPLHDTVELQLASYKSKLRSQILKSQSNGLKIVVGGKEKLDSFYKVYARNMHKLGVPDLGKTFFQKLISGYAHGTVLIFLVKFQEKIIGGSLVLTYGDFLEVGWASTLGRYNSLGTNMFMYNEMINIAIEKKMKVISFGRCTENSSTYNFKKQWQGEFHRIFYNFSEPHGESTSHLYSIFRKIYSGLPFPMIHWFGPFIRKRLIHFT
jgi:hypothetical protein